MAGLVVDRTVSTARSQQLAPPSQWVVLVAVAVGLLFGALACADSLAGGVGHGVTERPALETHEPPMAHADHVASMAQSEPRPTQPGDHGDHSGSSSMAGSHPGMACVVSVDLHFPEASSVSISDLHDFPQTPMNTGCPADVDPPVPRFS